MTSMDLVPSSKISRTEEGTDIISNLPDDVLGKILSYLPTKAAAATSVLSTKWKNIFPCFITQLVLDLDDYSTSSSISFITFVDKLLFETLCSASWIYYMALYCSKFYEDAKITSWVGSATTFNVKQLDLMLSLSDSDTLFDSINGSTSLESLNIFLESDLILPENFSLPSFRKLKLQKLIFHWDDYSVREFLEGCAVLEQLELMDCNLKSEKDVCILLPLLKNLRIYDCWKDSRCELVLDAPNLEMLFFIDCVARHYNLSKFKSIVTARIDLGPSKKQVDESDDEADYDEFGPWYVDVGIAKIVTACSNTTNLYLSYCTICSLNRSSIALPLFENLTWLTFESLSNGWALLACLLLSAPNLKKLGFEEEFEKAEGTYEDFQILVSDTPICLELHLKNIEFWVFNGREDEMKLLEYFLKSGKVLECAKLSCLIQWIFGRLLKMPSPFKISLVPRD